MPAETELLLHETFGDGVAPERTTLTRDGDALVLGHGGDETELDPALVVAVFARYAKELDPGVALSGPALPLGPGLHLRRLRHLARFDVIARDYLVLEREGEPPRVELATAITAALVHLAHAARRAP